MNETVNFEKQYEEKPDVIEVGDYVRIVENAEMYDDQDLIYLRDIQAVGVMRGELNTGDGWIAVQFPRGQFAFPRKEVYLVDVDALHGEMEEILADKAWQEAWNNYEENPTKENGAAFAIANLRVSLLEAESEIREVATERDMALAETVKAVNAANELHARNRLLEDVLRPFALAALDVRKHRYVSPDNSSLISTWDEESIYISEDKSEELQVRHLNEALDALPQLKPGGANAGGSSQ